MEPEGTLPADARADYRFFRFLTIGTSRLTIAGLIFAAWYLVWHFPGDILLLAADTTFIFLLSTTFLALLVSLFSGLVAYSLYKRRGGKIEKTPPPPGVPGRP